MTKVRITSGDYCFIAELLEEEAPKTCEAFKKMLPLKSEMIHVRWSGEGVWIPYGDLRLGLDYENHTSHPSKGEMLLYHDFGRKILYEGAQPIEITVIE